MPLPFTFPEWMPWWLQLLVVAVGLLLGLAFVVMPFSVFGVKSRLDIIEARLDEIQGEIRALVLRLPEPGREPYDAPAILRAAAPKNEAAVMPRTPPIPPASWEAEPPRESVIPTVPMPTSAPVEAQAAASAREAPPLSPPRGNTSPTLRAAARLGEAARERAEPRLNRPRENTPVGSG